MNKWMDLLACSGYMNEAGGDGGGGGGGGGAGDDDAAKAAAAAAAGDGDDDAAKAAAAAAAGDGDDDAAKAAAAAASGDGDDDKGADKNYHVPKARLDAATQRANRERDARIKLQEEFDTLKASGGAAAKADEGGVKAFETELEGLEDKLDAAIADGSTADARAVRKEMRTVERKINQAYVNEQTAAASTKTQNAVSASALLSSYEKDFPVLDPDSKTYDSALDTEVAEMKAGYEAIGYTPAEALSKAVGALVDTTPAGGGEARKTNVDKNLETHNKQPGKMAGADNGSNGMSKGIDPMQLSEKEFDNLTDEQISNLRGDEVTV